ncbi:MAG: hypothetical protein AB8G11_06250, partial [Saprospiraceae bacterium]
DCHKALMIYRHEYYGIDMDENGDDTAGKAEIILTASRDYGTGTVKVGFEQSTASFKNLFEGSLTSDNSQNFPMNKNDNFDEMF